MRSGLFIGFALMSLVLSESACSTKASSPNSASSASPGASASPVSSGAATAPAGAAAAPSAAAPTATSAPVSTAGSVAPVQAPSSQASAMPVNVLPSWIISVTPTNHISGKPDVRILFANDVAAAENLEDPDQKSLLSHITMDPSVAGHFSLLTPRMIGFQADAPFPVGAHFRVTLTKGLADQSSHVLDQDYTWTFDTDPLPTPAPLSSAPLEEAVPPISAQPPSDQLEKRVQAGTAIAPRGVAALLPLLVDQRLPMDIGGLDLMFSSTILPQTEEAVHVTLEDQLPLATSIASRVRVASDQIVLDRRYSQVVELAWLQHNLSEALAELRLLQRPDGGYAEWPSSTNSDVPTTTFCVVSLVRARAAGADVSSSLKNARSFLLAHLTGAALQKEAEPERSRLRLEIMNALDIAGSVRKEHIKEIYAQRNNLSFSSRAKLAHHLLHFPAWRAKGIALRQILLDQAYLSDRVVYGGGPRETTEARAQFIELLADSSKPASYLETAFRMLLELRSSGAWDSLKDNAEAMDAMLAYAKVQGKPLKFMIMVGVGDRELSASFEGYQNATSTWHIPMSKLPRPSSIIMIRKNGRGILHYLITFHGALRPDKPGVYNGLRVERFIRLDNKELAHFGITPLNGPLNLDGKRIFEIEDRVTVDHPVDGVVLKDAIPTGFVTMNDSLKAQGWYADYSKLQANHLVALTRHLDPGVYSMTYFVYAANSGTFIWPTAQVQVLDTRESGSSASGQVTISAP